MLVLFWLAEVISASCCRDLGYQAYEVEGNPDILYRPFVSVYFGAAYIKWLSNFEEE